MENSYNFEAVKIAYLSGYYHVAGDDAWYEDHDEEGVIKPDSGGSKAWADYFEEIKVELVILE